MARGIQALLFVVALMVSMVASGSGNKQRHHYGFLQQGHDYSDALSKSILFFEGQRSGKLPSTQRMTWRKDSALQDGQKNGVDLAGGYYDAGDNVKFGFPMAFTTTLLAWSIIEFGANMGSELQHALEAVKWGTDYLLKATAEPNKVYVQIGDPYSDHNCWERPEDMDTDRTPFFVDAQHPGSEVAAETAAALAASSIAFRSSDSSYADQLLSRATQVFDFADKFKGSYNDSLGQWVCPFYCDFNGYQDELIWGAAWMYKATNKREYLNYVFENENKIYWGKGAYGEFGWDDKHGGIAVLLCKDENKSQNPSGVSFCERSEEFVCAVLPESPTKTVTYSPGGLMFRPGGSNIQHPTALGFLLVVLGRQFSHTDRTIHCGGAQASPARLIEVAKSQVDYILGDNPLKMSYMVGYGDKFPRRIHHRAASLPSLDAHRDRMGCKDGTPYYESKNPDPNELTGALVGGPDQSDAYTDSRSMFVGSEPTTYMNAAMVGLLASFRT